MQNKTFVYGRFGRNVYANRHIHTEAQLKHNAKQADKKQNKRERHDKNAINETNEIQKQAQAI